MTIQVLITELPDFLCDLCQRQYKAVVTFIASGQHQGPSLCHDCARAVWAVAATSAREPEQAA